MTDLSTFSKAIIEKQNVILNNITDLSYNELIKMMASISAIISNLEKLQTNEDIKCNKIVSDQFLNDPKAAFAKAEAFMKSSDCYLAYKNILNLKQCATRILQILKIQIQFFLKSNINEEEILSE